MHLGIVGAGYIGQAVAKAAIRAGHEVMLSNSRGPQTLAGLAGQIGCSTGTPEEAAAFGDLVLVAIPLKNYPALTPEPFTGKVVLDSGNYYPQRDGHIAALDEGAITTCEILARQIPGAKIVKAFNSIFAAQIVSDGRPAGTPGRRALAIAGNDAAAKDAAAAFIDSIGFDVVDLGPLAEGWKIERARPAYCVPMDKHKLEATLAETTRQSTVPEGSWKR